MPGGYGALSSRPYAPWRPPHPRRFRALPGPKNPDAQGDLYRLVLLAVLNNAPPIAALSGEKKVKLSADKQLTVNAMPRGDLSRRGCENESSAMISAALSRHGCLWWSAACAAFYAGLILSAARPRRDVEQSAAWETAPRKTMQPRQTN